jgi:hypothetical protein
MGQQIILISITNRGFSDEYKINTKSWLGAVVANEAVSKI